MKFAIMLVNATINLNVDCMYRNMWKANFANPCRVRLCRNNKYAVNLKFEWFFFIFRQKPSEKVTISFIAYTPKKTHFWNWFNSVNDTFFHFLRRNRCYWFRCCNDFPKLDFQVEVHKQLSLVQKYIFPSMNVWMIPVRNWESKKTDKVVTDRENPTTLTGYAVYCAVVLIIR